MVHPFTFFKTIINNDNPNEEKSFKETSNNDIKDHKNYKIV